MKLTDIIFEIGEATASPYKYNLKLIKDNKSYDGTRERDWNGLFKTDSGDDIRVWIGLRMFGTNKKIKKLDLVFDSKVGSKYSFDLTDRGITEMFKVMSTVVAITKEVIKREKKETGVPVKILSFSGTSTGKNLEKNDPKYKEKREKLYLYYINKLIKPKKIERSGFDINVYL